MGLSTNPHNAVNKLNNITVIKITFFLPIRSANVPKKMARTAYRINHNFLLHLLQLGQIPKASINKGEMVPYTAISYPSNRIMKNNRKSSNIQMKTIKLTRANNLC